MGTEYGIVHDEEFLEHGFRSVSEARRAIREWYSEEEQESLTIEPVCRAHPQHPESRCPDCQR